MKNILILGAGLSSSVLIDYLMDGAEENDWHITVGDFDKKLAERKIHGHNRASSIFFDVNDCEMVETEIAKVDLVVSMLPARFHPIIAQSCLRQEKHMVTASYVSPDMKALHEEVKAKGLIFLNELGVDPGLDHMSAMKVIDDIRAKGGKIISFKSSTGGLVAPEYDNNPWNYKFTWNPRNVVLAGQGTARFLRNGKFKYIPYYQLFKRTLPTSVLNYGDFEIYMNRDSLSYREIYGLQDIPTIFRGTLRRPGYCEAWDTFVQLGATDDTYYFENSENLTYRDFINSFLRYEPDVRVEDKLAAYLNIDSNCEVMKKLEWLGIFSEKKIGLKKATPAQILQKILEEKWSLGPEDKDMIVMQHQFEYELNGKNHGLQSSFAFIGKDTTKTAMAITVGMPAAIATKLLLTGVITRTGVSVPVTPDLYEPILNELKEFGIKFIEEEIPTE
jgi:saccharopine dehydrogenase-like NADP-dependent oxidoreductase